MCTKKIIFSCFWAIFMFSVVLGQKWFFEKCMQSKKFIKYGGFKFVFWVDGLKAGPSSRPCWHLMCRVDTTVALIFDCKLLYQYHNQTIVMIFLKNVTQFIYFLHKHTVALSISLIYPALPAAKCQAQPLYSDYLMVHLVYFPPCWLGFNSVNVGVYSSTDSPL